MPSRYGDAVNSSRATFFGLILAATMAFTASASAGVIVNGEWSVTIDDTPSPDFVATALHELNEYYKPWTPPTNLNLCCLGVGNVGGLVEHDRDDEDFPFVEIDDDVDEDPFVVAVKSASCETEICVAISHFRLKSGAAAGLENYLVEFLEHSHEQFVDAPIYWKLIPGEYPVLIGDFNTAPTNSLLWSVTLSAVPEPSANLLHLWGLAAISVRTRKR